MIGENEKLEEQLKELKDDTEETRKLLDTKDASIKEKEKVINNQKIQSNHLKRPLRRHSRKIKHFLRKRNHYRGN